MPTPAAPPADTLQAEAVMLARYCALQRRDYLFEVEHCAHRGQAVADLLRERVATILAQRAAAVR